MRRAIRSLTNMMRLDYGGLFTHQFPKDDKGREREVKAWQFRLLSKLRGLDPRDVLDGYDTLLGEKPSALPTVPELVAATLRQQKLRLKESQGQAEAERVALLPPKPEVPDTVARQNLAKIREMLGQATAGAGAKETEAEREARLKRLADKVAAHEALLQKDFPLYGKPLVVKPAHQCAVGWCDRPGTTSSGTKGDGKYYCGEHYRSLK